MSSFYVYRHGDRVKGAYLLSRGRLYIELKGGEVFSIGGASSRIIFGVIELLIKKSAKTGRFFSVRVDKGSDVIDISRALIYDSLKSFKRSLPMARTLALILLNLDNLVVSRMRLFEEAEQLSHKYDKIFAWAVNELSLLADANDKKLQDFYLEKKNTLMYTRGLGFESRTISNIFPSPSIANLNLGDYSKSVSAGYFLCREGDTGSSFFILLKGTVRIWKGNKVINEVSGVGSLLGDMVFWLGANRTASMQALTDIELIEVSKDAIDKILLTNSGFIRFLIADLSHRILNHCNKVHELNISLAKISKYNKSAVVELRRFRGDLVRIMLDNDEAHSLLDIKDGIRERLFS